MDNTKYQKLEKTILKVNPKATASLLSSLTFWWMNEIFKTGSQQPLEITDLYPLLKEDQTQEVTETLRRAWEQQGEGDDKSNSNSRRLFWALIKMSPWYYYGFIACTGLVGAICNICQPVFIGLLLAAFLGQQGSHRDLLYVYACGLCLSSLIRVVVLHQFLYNAWLMAMRWRVATMGLMFNKILRLSQTTIANVTTGYIINLVSGDVQRFDPVVSQIALFFQGIFEIVTVSALLAYVIGVQALSGVAFLVVLVFYYCGMGRICVHLRNKIAKVADERLGLMNAVVAGIRTVKMYAWEWSFRDRVSEIRSQEFRFLRLKGAILATFQSFLYTSQGIVVFISLSVLLATGVNLTTFTIFMLLSFINTLRSSVSWNVAEGANYFGDFASALNRIQAFLELPELEFLDDGTVQKNNQNRSLSLVRKKESGVVTHKTKDVNLSSDTQEPRYSINMEILVSDQSATKKNPTMSLDDNDVFQERKHVSLSRVTCFWNGEISPSIRDVTLEVRNSDLVLVTGPVGCGKTSLLSTILGELPIREGEMFVTGRTVYVPQQPWVFSGTVRENIVFGQKYQQWKYQVVIKACDLEKDIDSFPDKDMTLIGEHGVLLSGGQRTRVGLARALYADADVYLLDDPLSAVDAKVGRHIFNECICGILNTKTRVLVTHQLQYLKGADHVVVMNAGSIVHEGTYEELCADPDVELECLVGKYDDSPPLTRSMDTRRLSSASSLKDGVQRGLEIAEEDRMTGSVSWGLYWKYLQAGTWSSAVVLLLIFFIVSQAFIFYPDWWLLHITKLPSDQRNNSTNLYIYGGLVALAFLLSAIRAFLFLFATLNSSKNLHNQMTVAVLKAPVLFFDTNPTGRILNRFSRDISVIDDLLPVVFLDAVQLMLFCVGAIVLPSILNPWVILAAVPMVVTFIFISRYYLKTSRELRRLEALNRSPVFSHYSDALEGLVSIRTHRMQGNFIKTFYRYQNEHNQVWFTLLSSLRWLGIRLDLLCVLFTVVVVFSAIASESGAGAMALSLIYALQLAVDTSQYGVRQCSETENYMTSVERVMSYAILEQEPGYGNEIQPPADWPSAGELQLQHVSLAYYPGAPEVLIDINFRIGSEEKIGIAGRTGAGKSSLVSALFRMPDPDGQILIDGIDTKTLNIQSSRRAVSVISQDPVLFTGSLRLNLDPFDKYTDDDIWEALDGASLKATIENMPSKLNQQLMECGSNLSAGERQLLCLARALLQRNKIIVMDEATANVDYKTDSLIQETIRTKFKKCTVITIAHRLNTIMDYDRILVMENGKVVEFDTPQELLKKSNGVLRQLYQSHINHST